MILKLSGIIRRGFPFFTFVVLTPLSTARAQELDLDMTGHEYRVLLEKPEYSDAKEFADDPNDQQFADIQAMGKRNLDWFININKNRPPAQQLQLYNPQVQSGTPIDKPNEYNEEIVLASYAKLQSELPPEYSAVLFAKTPLPPNHPLAADEDYLAWARKTDRVYQSASRWLIMKPNLIFLAQRASGDIRGHYFLSRIPELQTKLSNWGSLNSEDQKNYSFWLTLNCKNTATLFVNCNSKMDSAIKKNTVSNYYAQYKEGAKKRFDSYFVIGSRRSDIKWSSADANNLYVPFVDPQNFEVLTWLRDNIQDEWQWSNWQLNLNFIPSGSTTTQVQFVAGATPHVNALAGNFITMDANAPLQDYGSRWTIRHEYGHTLGIPDCYIEFYDTERKVIINYQIDLDNLMCSRRGHLQEKHYEELKRVYFAS